jgi:hypothetical protein
VHSYMLSYGMAYMPCSCGGRADSEPLTGTMRCTHRWHVIHDHDGDHEDLERFELDDALGEHTM